MRLILLFLLVFFFPVFLDAQKNNVKFKLSNFFFHARENSNVDGLENTDNTKNKTIDFQLIYSRNTKKSKNILVGLGYYFSDFEIFGRKEDNSRIQESTFLIKQREITFYVGIGRYFFLNNDNFIFETIVGVNSSLTITNNSRRELNFYKKNKEYEFGILTTKQLVNPLKIRPQVELNFGYKLFKSVYIGIGVDYFFSFSFQNGLEEKEFSSFGENMVLLEKTKTRRRIKNISLNNSFGYSIFLRKSF